MQTRRRTAQLQAVQLRTGQLKDEVYRHMFRLEERRPGADMGLALALLRAWIAYDGKPNDDEERDWLRKISPICFQMIETATKAAATIACVQ